MHLGRVAGPPERVSQTRLLAHSDGDVVVPIILGDQGHHRPVPGGVGGVDGDELFSAVLGEPVHLNGVAHGVGEKEHLNLGEEQTLKGVAGSHSEGCGSPPAPALVSPRCTAQLSHSPSSSPWAQPPS